MKETKKEKAVSKQTITMLNTEIKVKYPPGSMIVFAGSLKIDADPNILSCSYYDKVGGQWPLKNTVSDPPEWQNLTREEAMKVCEMFDKHRIMGVKYV